MKVLVMHNGQDAQDYYRVREPVRAIREAGLGIEIETARGITTTMTRPTDGSEPEVYDADARDADVVVLQLPKTDAMLQTIRVLQAKGVAVVVEMDDLLSAVPYGHLAHQALVRKGMGRKAAECARAADLVTTTTPALLEEYAPHRRGVVVPNAVPRRVAELPPAYEREPGVVTVGWTGSVYSHPYDLQEMGSGLQQALDATRGSSRFTVIGQVGDARERLRLSEEPAEVPWVEGVDAYTRAIGEHFDLGLAPLRIDRFNTCKSWLKALEYAARGVPFVRSATADYERLGLGWRAKSPKDWAKALTSLIRDRDRRTEQAIAARETVLASHLTEHTVDLWVGAWQQALDNRAGSRRRYA
ncbi:glycosyltransferase family 4 protein [Blastococcus saxobsidens]|uniref:Glycosyltransferase family 4 protein n=1 Tax=Blastococcus saxobsidens TaxID=138336 RepID=A0A6L9W277_9ACTN|nr:glycosyltransferase [Blastococcus saxobsidens]NEK85554.1 glycosyltransferase family 4 protein [Blastococcus saxobsidens]